MKIQSKTLILPASWASYLVNGDASGISAEEIRECDEVLSRNGLSTGNCAACGEEFFEYSSDASRQAGNVCEFLFLYSATARAV